VPSDRSEQSEAAAVLRQLLAAVDAGELEANTPQAKALLRRLEGALIALEQSPQDDER
jgi:hypothetical protein